MGLRGERSCFWDCQAGSSWLSRKDLDLVRTERLPGAHAVHGPGALERLLALDIRFLHRCCTPRRGWEVLAPDARLDARGDQWQIR